MTKNNRSADRSYCYNRIKGFMPVLLQATTNPALQSRYAARNCFRIAKHFSSHAAGSIFPRWRRRSAIVAARTAPVFGSKGGAADYPRRVHRALFLGDPILHARQPDRIMSGEGAVNPRRAKSDRISAP